MTELNNFRKRQDRPFYRWYTTKMVNGEKVNVLTAWMQRRCKMCGKYIGGTKQFLCERCYKKRHSKQTKINHLERRNQVRYYSMESIRKETNVPLSRHLRNSLRVYM